MVLRPLTLSFCLIFAALPTLAQQPGAINTVAKDAQAVSVLNQVFATAGGFTALSAIQDATATGTITYSQPQGFEGTVTIRASGLGDFRIDATLPDGIRSQAVSNDQVSVTGVGGSVVTMNSQAPACPSRILLPYLLLVPALNSPGFSLSYNGLGQLDGRSVHDIQVQEVILGLPDASGIFARYHTIDFFIDATTLEILMMQDTLPQNLTRQIFFSNYQIVSGVLVPFSVSEQSGGLTTWTAAITQINFNTGLQDSDFLL
jgi:hypothetical protein